MPVVLIIIGLLLLLFGGGCTLIFLVTGAMDPRAMLADKQMLLSIWVPFGLVPLVAGWFIFRYGLRRDREKRGAVRTKPPGGSA